MNLTIQQAGLLSLLQDLGRYGYQDIGVTTGGPMDSHAFRWANKLLDNPENATQIEITLGPFKACFNEATSFSICGAESVVMLNGKEIQAWASYHAKSGDIIELGYATKGLRTYLAVAGGFTVTNTLNSSGTVIRDKLGGLKEDGQKLQDHDCIPYLAKKILLQEKYLASLYLIIQIELRLEFYLLINSIYLALKQKMYFSILNILSRQPVIGWVIDYRVHR